MQALGLKVNYKKCYLTPVQPVQFVCMKLDSIQFIFMYIVLLAMDTVSKHLYRNLDEDLEINE